MTAKSESKETEKAGKAAGHALASAASAAIAAGKPAAADPLPVPEAEDMQSAVTVLVNAAMAVTKQAAAEVTAWAVAMAPTYAVAAALKRAGDPRGEQVMRAANTHVLMMAGNLGIRLLQSQETALLGAISGGIAMIGGPAAGAIAPAVVATAGAISNALNPAVPPAGGGRAPS